MGQSAIARFFERGAEPLPAPDALAITGTQEQWRKPMLPRN
jgi:hypothetical protein